MQSPNENQPAENVWVQLTPVVPRKPDAIDLAVTELVRRAKSIREQSILIDRRSKRVLDEADEAHDLWRQLSDTDRMGANHMLASRGEGASVLDVLRDVFFYLIDWDED